VFSNSFQREVWTRISIAQRQSWPAQWQRRLNIFFFWIARPVPASVLATIMLFAGIELGNLTAPEGSADSLRGAYIASVNPMISAHNFVR